MISIVVKKELSVQMADLTEAQAAQSVKIAGANPSTGAEDSFMEVDSSGNAQTVNNNGSGASAVNIQDGGNSITVDGTITANQGAPNTDANAWPSKITDGTDTAKITTNSDLSVSDGLRDGGVYGALTLTTGGTTYEAKVGGSRLANRKCLTITAMDDMYWGYSSSVTTSNGTPLYKNQQIIFSIDPDSTFQVWLVASSSSKSARISEST